MEPFVHPDRVVQHWEFYFPTITEISKLKLGFWYETAFFKYLNKVLEKCVVVVFLRDTVFRLVLGLNIAWTKVEPE